MKRGFILLVILGQLAVLAYMAAEREWIVRNGSTLLLRTAPVDPRDVMRGDFIRFDYEIGHVPVSQCEGAVKAWAAETKPRSYRTHRDDVVYATVRLDADKVASLVGLSDRRPESGLFLRGRVVSVTDRMVNVRFGLEALFTPQGEAREFEDEARKRAGLPVDVEVAVSGSGTGVAKGYRWEPIGITIELDRPPRDPEAPRRRTVPAAMRGATVELKNYSDRPVAIVVRPQGQSFRLVRNERAGDTRLSWVGEGRALPRVDATMIRVLAPGATYRERLDFNDPAWFVRDERNPGAAPHSIAVLQNTWGATFRLEYAPPEPGECAGLPDAALIRHSRLRSRAFSVAGVD